MLKEVLTAPTEKLGRWSRFAIFQMRLARQCVRLLKQNHSGRQAAALSYHTIFGIVPLAIMILMVFQLFPAYRDVGERVKGFVYKQLLLDFEYPADLAATEAEAVTIKPADKIEELAEGFFTKQTKGSITIFSGVIVIWASLGLLTTIERAFNNIWHVSSGRNFLNRIINYWALLTLGPLLLGLGFYVSTRYLIMNDFEGIAFGNIQMVLPYVISVAALFFLYFVIPNTKVNVKAALWGAMVAALIWTGAKYLFAVYVTKFIPYSQVYGIMGLIPLSIFWIYITWLIVLFGLQLTFATQHLKTLDAAEIASMEKTEEYFIVNDLTVIKILGYIFETSENKHSPVPQEVICGKFNLPAEFGEKILEHLVASGLLFRTAEPNVGFTPATSGDNITLADISDVVAKASFVQQDDDTSAQLRSIINSQRQTLSGCTLKEILRQQSSKTQPGNVT